MKKEDGSKLRVTVLGFRATGRRKTSVAQVCIKSGKGNIVINKKPIGEYFKRPLYQSLIKKPLILTNSLEKFDVKVKVNGGGLTGQADAIRLGIARALLKCSHDLKSILSSNKLLRRDPRMVERKKYGRRGARASYQFSKR